MESCNMDGTEYTEDSKRLSFNFSGDSGHSSGIEPNVSLVHPCGNSSCEKYRRQGCPYSTTELVLIVMVTGSLSLTTILGNALVMLSIKVNRHLQTVNNYFLFSLACADLIIGLLSMNLYTLYIIMGYWPLGPVVCDLWLALDYMVSNASVMNLLIISFDRYFCVTRPLTYPARRTTRLAGLMIAAAWVLSFILWAPAILFWQSFMGKRIVPDGECYIQLLSNPAVTLGTILSSFYLPAAIMIILYARISLASHSRLTKIQSESKRARPSSGLLKHWRSCVSSQPDIVTKPKSDSDKLNKIVSVEGETSVCPKQRVKERNTANKITQLSIVHNGSSTSDNQPRTLLYTAGFSTRQAKRRRRFETREKKMTKIIFAILLVFILTWTPYSVMAVIGTFCHSCVSDTVWTMGYWLCYINSTINPGCYALCNLTFRKTFRNLLRCQYKNMGRK